MNLNQPLNTAPQAPLFGSLISIDSGSPSTSNLAAQQIRRRYLKEDFLSVLVCNCLNF